MWFVNTFFKKSLTNPHLVSIDSLAKYTKSKPNRAIGGCKKTPLTEKSPRP